MADSEMKTLTFQGKSGKLLIRDNRFNPVAKTEGMTQSVGVDADGKFWTAPGSSGSTSTEVTDDGNGNITIISLASSFSVTDDGAGNVKIL